MGEPAVLDKQEVAVAGAATVIERLPTAVTAFVGRCLRGPVNHPVVVRSFAEYQLRFGGLWQPSTLSYAIEQFFDNGGRVAIVVRVCNGGHAPTLTLPAGREWLLLRGLAPGSREYLRASVDYDGVAEHEADRFNLVVQRLRAAGTEQIDDQESFRRVSIHADAERSLASLITQSHLVRLADTLPSERPARTAGPAGAAVGYVTSNTDGDDGAVLTDYDVIGSAEHHSGLFALQGAGHFSLLCIPPLSREQDVGLSTLVVAARLCRRRQAMLIVDPPAAWNSAESALAALRSWPYQSPDACMFFPRVLAVDRLRGRPEVFASCGAAAGSIARADESCPPWAPAAADEESLLKSPLRPAIPLSDADVLRLAHCGVNTLRAVRSQSRSELSGRTLLPDNAGRSDWRYLSVRRFGQFVGASICEGTRWVLLESGGASLWSRVTAQVSAFLEALDQEGAFVGDSGGENYYVICDARLNGPGPSASPGVRILFGFAALRPGEFHTFLVSHQPLQSRVHAVSVNRLAMGGNRMDEEIETAILRGLAEVP